MSKLRTGAPDWLPRGLVNELEGRLWHATNASALKMIVQDGFIGISAASKYPNGFCRGIGAVSLFDFCYPDPPPYMTHWSQWISREPSQPSYWLEVDRELAQSSILDPERLLQRWRDERAADKMRIIAGIESAHLGPLPIDHVRRALKISHPQFTVIPKLK